MKNSHTMNNFLHHKIFLDGFHLNPPFSPHWEKLADGFSTGSAKIPSVTTNSLVSNMSILCELLIKYIS